jgi:hypothetical protein
MTVTMIVPEYIMPDQKRYRIDNMILIVYWKGNMTTIMYDWNDFIML